MPNLFLRELVFLDNPLSVGLEVQQRAVLDFVSALLTGIALLRD
jgi:hypothetical protein